MPRLPHEQLLELKARLPRGNDGIWSVILEEDAKGPWTPADICRRTNLNHGTPRDFIRRLQAGGYLIDAGKRLARGKNPQPAQLYRLAQRPSEAPRLRRDGTACPERGIETLWRTMKMTKVFTVSELTHLASKDGGLRRNTVDTYCRRLANAGVLAILPGKGRERSFRLVLNVGSRAPKILSAHVVFDPNANVVIGEATLSEVKS